MKKILFIFCLILTEASFAFPTCKLNEVCTINTKQTGITLTRPYAGTYSCTLNTYSALVVAVTPMNGYNSTPFALYLHGNQTGKIEITSADNNLDTMLFVETVLPNDNTSIICTKSAK